MLKTRDFYPRPPGGGRQHELQSSSSKILISIHALRVEGDAGHIRFYTRRAGISIHALRVEGDSKAPEFCIRIIISIHALRVEGDIHWIVKTLMLEDFYPRPPGGGRLLPPRSTQSLVRHFYPRPPGGGRLVW